MSHVEELRQIHADINAVGFTCIYYVVALKHVIFKADLIICKLLSIVKGDVSILLLYIYIYVRFLFIY